MKQDSIKGWIESKYGAKCNGSTHAIRGSRGMVYVDYKLDGVYVKTSTMVSKVLRYEDKWLFPSLAEAIDELL